MAVKKHPDYHEEAERLEFTKQAIVNTIELIDQNRQDYQKNIRVAFENLDYLDSSQSYITILTNSKFIELDERTREKLVNIRKKPYFGRVDFKNNGHQKAERIYLGKAPLYRNNHDKPLIVDWRAPIANVYYEGRLGEMSYETPTGTVKGELVLKRQYTISDGELEHILDIDLTTTDTFLQSSLKVEADNRLKDIAATIQAEQNRIIRADLDLPLIVQGVAGSGKTTIALHRIAYLIYTYEKDFIPENFMIIAPNKLFLNYISEVLPELGVERVNQTTFIDLIYQLIGKKYKLASLDEKLMSLINEGSDHEKAALLKRASAFKGSLEFKEIIDDYVDDLEQDFVPREDFNLGVYTILTSGDIYNIFTGNYPYLPLYMRIKELKKLLSSKLKLASEKIYERLAQEYEMQLDRVRANMTDGEEKSKRLVKLIDAKHNKLAHLQKEAKTVVNAYLARFPRQDLFTYYRNLVANEGNLARYAGGRLDKEEIAFICNHSAKLLDQKQFEIEDSAGLSYLQYRLFGFAEKMEVSNVVIDEAQDSSIFQL